MSLMKKSMFITMPDQSVWAIPLQLVAMHRAKHYAESDTPESVQKSLEENTLPLFEEDPFEVEDWAANNMDWSEVEAHAVMVTKGEVDYQEGWMNGEKTIK